METRGRICIHILQLHRLRRLSWPHDSTSHGCAGYAITCSCQGRCPAFRLPAPNRWCTWVSPSSLGPRYAMSVYIVFHDIHYVRSPFVSILARKYGKRPQFLFACIFGVIGTGICIAGFSQPTLSQSYDVLLAGRMVQGLGTTAFESLSVAAIGDMFFLHERGLRTALLVLTLACLSSLVAIIGGTTFEHLGARTLFVILLPFQIFGALGAFFFLPESQYRRLEAAPISSSEEIGHREKGSGNDLTEDAAFQGTGSTIAKRSFVQDLRVNSGTYNEDSIFKLLADIFLQLLNPAVVWVQLVSAVLVVRPFLFPKFLSSEFANSNPVFLRRYSLHSRSNFFSAPVQAHRLPKRVLLHRCPCRWHCWCLCWPDLRFRCAYPCEAKQRSV